MRCVKSALNELKSTFCSKSASQFIYNIFLLEKNFPFQFIMNFYESSIILIETRIHVSIIREGIIRAFVKNYSKYFVDFPKENSICRFSNRKRKKGKKFHSIVFFSTYYIYITMQYRFRIKLQVLNKEIVNRKMTRSRSGLSQMQIIYLTRFIYRGKKKEKRRPLPA